MDGRTEMVEWSPPPSFTSSSGIGFGGGGAGDDVGRGGGAVAVLGFLKNFPPPCGVGCSWLRKFLTPWVPVINALAKAGRNALRGKKRNHLSLPSPTTSCPVPEREKSSAIAGQEQCQSNLCLPSPSSVHWERRCHSHRIRLTHPPLSACQGTETRGEVPACERTAIGLGRRSRRRPNTPQKTLARGLPGAGASPHWEHPSCQDTRAPRFWEPPAVQAKTPGERIFLTGGA